MAKVEDDGGDPKHHLGDEIGYGNAVEDKGAGPVTVNAVIPTTTNTANSETEAEGVGGVQVVLNGDDAADANIGAHSNGDGNQSTTLPMLMLLLTLMLRQSGDQIMIIPGMQIQELLSWKHKLPNLLRVVLLLPILNTLLCSDGQLRNCKVMIWKCR